MSDIKRDGLLIEQLKQAVVDAGFSIMPNDEFEAWCKAQDEYLESPEGRAKEYEADILLNYYLEHDAEYKWADGMGEISGFGGGYEKCCQAMLDSALQWFDQNPNANPKFKGLKDIYGIILEDNEDASALSKAVLKPALGDATGAMHQVVIASSFWIRKNGWDKYIEKMKER